MRRKKKSTAHKARKKMKTKGGMGVGFLYVILIMLLLSAASFYFMGGKLPTENPPQSGQVVIPITNTPEPQKNNLQLYTFGFATATPKPIIEKADQCLDLRFDQEGESSGKKNIFIAVDPPLGSPINPNGQIRAWVNDGQGGSVAAGTDAGADGKITIQDRGAKDADNPTYLYEPAMYLTNLGTNPTAPFKGDVEQGGTPYFPTMLKGKVSQGVDGNFMNIPPMDDPSPFRIQARTGHGSHTGEFIWEVGNLKAQGVTDGTYRAQITVHDGDGDLAIECTTLIIGGGAQPAAPAAANPPPAAPPVP